MLGKEPELAKNQNYLHPTLENLLQFHADSFMLFLSVHHFGTISSFDSVTQTANATIDYSMVNYVYNGQTGQNSPVSIAYPPIVGAPVRFPFSQTYGGTTYPVGVGDKCEVVFNDRDMDLWTLGQIQNQNGIPSPPASSRLHQFSDAIIIVGINPPATPIPSFSATKPMLRNSAGNAFVAVDSSNGKIGIQNPSQNLYSVLTTMIGHLESLSNACGSLKVLGVATGAGISGIPQNAATFSSLASDLANDATNLGELLE